ncbi:MAG: CRISPR-associated endoribonuclease Cas6 [Vallitalea sp.]|jgi:CRISPR-associated endoribonuclease Cas6|nr:CRISPR-associated endoribonuclease Cas6 [Vallitalea sp.]
MHNRVFYELNIKITINQDLQLDNSLNYIGNFIKFYKIFNDKLKAEHITNNFKNYVFSNLYPIPKDKVYKKNKIYSLKIRSIDQELINYFFVQMNEKRNYKMIHINEITMSSVSLGKIIKIYSLNPAIILKNNGYITNQDDIEEVKKRITNNLLMKFRTYIDEDKIEDVNFIKSIKCNNRKPIGINYTDKNIKFLGNKYDITIKEDRFSQELALYAIALGIGEKNSIVGGGFCEYYSE